MSSFEQQKNTKAAAYTAILIGLILILCFTLAWTPPSTPEPKEEEGMEVNLGNSETGEGEIQPLVPGAPANAEENLPVSSPPSDVPAPVEKEIETNEIDKEAPPVVVKKTAEKKPDKPKPRTDTKPEATPKPAAAKATTSPTPAPAPKPKYLYKGDKAAEGNGGNNAAVSQPGNNQGIAGGKGDQGKINGDPNAEGYNGNGGSGKGGGVSISRGLQGRKINRFPSFEDDFSENAKVAVDIKLDAQGNVISASIQPRGTTTGNSAMKAIALRKARQLKFSADEEGPEEQLGTILFDFRIKN